MLIVKTRAFFLVPFSCPVFIWFIPAILEKLQNIEGHVSISLEFRMDHLQFVHWESVG